MELETVDRCPLCGAGERALLYDGLTDRVFGAVEGEWSLCRCGECDAAYLDPRPTQASLPEAYASYYTHDSSPAPGEDSVLRRARTALRNGYVNSRWGTALSPSWSVGAIVMRLSPAQRILADATFRHPPAGGRRLLDVGCGDGSYVALMRDAGWEATGIDVDERGLVAGRREGLDLRATTLAAVASESPGSYDAVTMNHVIEHVSDPVALLRDARRALRRGGQLWIRTPNLDGRGHATFGRDWLHLDPPRHLVIFTAGTLRRAVADAGFAAVRGPRSVPTARPAFRLSAVLRGGADVVRGRDRLALAVTDLAGRFRPHRADELVVTAEA